MRCPVCNALIVDAAGTGASGSPGGLVPAPPSGQSGADGSSPQASNQVTRPRWHRPSRLPVAPAQSASGVECPFCHTPLRQPEGEAPPDNGIVVLYQEDRVAGELTPAPMRPGPRAMPTWPLLGLAGASVLVFVVISVLL